MLKIFSRNREKQKDEQALLFYYIEKIVNITITKIKNHENKSVVEILTDLETIFRKFWKLRNEQREKFDSLLWSKDFYKNYIQPLGRKRELGKENSVDTESAEKLKQEAELEVALLPQKHLKGLTQFLNSFEKIWDSAFRNDNKEISTYVMYQIKRLIAELSHEPSNNLFIDQFLRLLSSISYKGMRLDDKDIDASIYHASVYWYPDIVFEMSGGVGSAFDLSYLEDFDRHYFSSLKLIVSENKEDLFKAFVGRLIDSTLTTSYITNEIWDYADLVTESKQEKHNKGSQTGELYSRIGKLVKQAADSNAKEELDEHLKELGEFRSETEIRLDAEEKEKVKTIQDRIKEHILSRYKFNNLLRLVFAVGAYCLFKGRLDYIRYLWEYNQPSDSDTHWIGHNIVPDSLDEVIYPYFRRPYFDRKFDFWEGHHGTEPYFRNYFLLLVIRLLGPMKSDADGKYQEIEGYKLPPFDIHRLSSIKHLCDEFTELAKRLKERKDDLECLGFNANELDDIFDKKLVAFFKKLKSEAENQISREEKEGTISPKKKNEFRNNVIEEFKKTVILRNILEHYKCYVDSSGDEYYDENKLGKLDRRGINVIDDKASFFEEWHTTYIDWGNAYGRSLAIGEDSAIIAEILNQCQKPEGAVLEQVLEKFDKLSDAIILAPSSVIYQFFEMSKDFRPQWRSDVTSKIPINSFKGWFVFRKQEIPVFRTNQREKAEQIIILNSSKMGNLIQYSPFDKGEAIDLKEDVFYMNIRAFSENEELMNNTIKEGPQWLKEIGDEEEQKKYLKTKVLIHILERFKYNRPKDFEGYLCKVNTSGWV